MTIELPVHIESVGEGDDWLSSVYESDGTFLCTARDKETAEAIARALNAPLVDKMAEELRGDADCVSLPLDGPEAVRGHQQQKRASGADVVPVEWEEFTGQEAIDKGWKIEAGTEWRHDDSYEWSAIDESDIGTDFYYTFLYRRPKPTEWEEATGEEAQAKGWNRRECEIEIGKNNWLTIQSGPEKFLWGNRFRYRRPRRPHSA